MDPSLNDDDDDIAIAADDDDDLQLVDSAASPISKFSKPTTVVSPLQSLPRKKTHLLSVKSSESLFPTRTEPMQANTDRATQAVKWTVVTQTVTRHCVSQAAPRTTVAQSLPATAVVKSSSCTVERRGSVSPTTSKARQKKAAGEGAPVQQIPGSQVQAVRPITQPSSALQAVFSDPDPHVWTVSASVCGIRNASPPPHPPPPPNEYFS
jgi:hypothetical protein